MKIPANLGTGSLAGGGAALLLAAKLTILTMWYLGITDAKAPFEVIDAATTVITSFWSAVLTVLGAGIGYIVHKFVQEVPHVREAETPAE